MSTCTTHQRHSSASLLCSLYVSRAAVLKGWGGQFCATPAGQGQLAMSTDIFVKTPNVIYEMIKGEVASPHFWDPWARWNRAVRAPHSGEGLTQEMEPLLNPVTILPCFWTETPQVGVSSLTLDKCCLPCSFPVAELHRLTAPTSDTVSSTAREASAAVHIHRSETSPRIQKTSSAVSRFQALT